jgi:cation:H+ antiporter
MILAWARLIVGGFLLYLGAEWFVAGASALALAMRVSQLVVGLTVVAYGTSAPELIVGLHAARTGHGAVALGNVLGSNIANIGLILGLTALVKPIAVAQSLRRRELPVLVLGAGLVVLFLRDGAIDRIEAALLLLLACLYTAWTIRTSRRAADLGERSGGSAHAPRGAQIVRASFKAAAGLVILLAGGSWFVDGAVALARGLGLGERLVGLTIVAVGTSLPELVTSVVAARRGHADLALGNVLGSNIFNVFLCLGTAALAGPVGASLTAIPVDAAAFLFMTALAALYIRRPRSISRTEGAVALAAYVLAIVLAIASG